MESEKATKAFRHSMSPFAPESPKCSPLSSGKSTEARFNPDRFVVNDLFAADPDFKNVRIISRQLAEAISFYHVENTQPGNNYATKSLFWSGFVSRPAWLPHSKSSAELFGQF
jgi:hypothetical protein